MFIGDLCLFFFWKPVCTFMHFCIQIPVLYLYALFLGLSFVVVIDFLTFLASFAYWFSYVLKVYGVLNIVCCYHPAKKDSNLKNNSLKPSKLLMLFFSPNFPAGLQTIVYSKKGLALLWTMVQNVLPKFSFLFSFL